MATIYKLRQQLIGWELVAFVENGTAYTALTTGAAKKRLSATFHYQLLCKFR